MALSEGKTVNGKKEGYWITYYANGNKRSEGAYKKGTKNGKWIQYFKSGNISSEGHFKNGEYENWYVTYFENGHKKWEGDYGPHVGKSYDGRKEGEWTCYSATDGKTSGGLLRTNTAPAPDPINILSAPAPGAINPSMTRIRTGVRSVNHPGWHGISMPVRYRIKNGACLI